MFKQIRCRIYPNKFQKEIIEQTFYCCNVVYNKGIDMREEAYRSGSPIGYKETAHMLTELKRQKDFEFLQEADSIALQQTLRNLDSAYRTFFQHKTKHPAKKQYGSYKQAYRTVNNVNQIRVENNRLKLPKVGRVKIKPCMNGVKITHVVVEKVPSGKYFALLYIKFDPLVINSKGAVGIDVGIKTFYTSSDGDKVDNPKYLEKATRKLIREQRRLNRKQYGSKNWEKQRVRIAIINEKIVNQRGDFLHKQSTKLVKSYHTICREKLTIKDMLKNKKLRKSILSASWGKFFQMLNYKSEWYGNEIIEIPTEFPSSQLCSCCGYRNAKIKNLKVRKWTCPRCNTTHDRDINASINILRRGFQEK